MKLTEIKLRQFRQFDVGIDIADLATGINIFHGPNESGKSTLAQAIRAAFFERHGSSTLADLQPWGDSSAAPEVTLRFDFNARNYHLVKRFVRQKRCDLTVDGQTRSGDEAEQTLAQMMGFVMPPRGSSRPDHWGIPGLLWVEQGAGHNLESPVSYAHEHLQGILNEAVGEVASSAGDLILQKVEERLARLVTRATGTPTQDYRKTLDAKTRLEDELAVLVSKVHDYQEQIDLLTSLQMEQKRDDLEQPWRALRQKEQDARKQLDDVNLMRDTQKREQAALEVCKKTQALHHEQLQTFEQQRQALRTREVELNRLRDEHQGLSGQTASLQHALDVASAIHKDARESLRRGRQAQLLRDKKDRLTQFRAETTRLSQQRDQAVKIQRLLLADQQRACKLKIAPDALTQMRALHAQIQELEIRQQTVATRLQFELEPGQHVNLDAATITGQAEHRLLNETTLIIPGTGRVRITPGGEDVARLAREHDRVNQEWTACLHRLSVSSLEQAQERAAEYADIMAQIRQHEAVLTLHAPNGLAVLEQRLDELSTQVKTLQAEYDALGPLSQTASESQDLPTIQHNELEAERQLKASEAALQTHRVATATAQAALDAATREWQLAQASINDAHRVQTEQQTLKRLNEERAQEAMLNERITTLQTKIDAVRPEILEQDIARYGQSAARLQEASAERERTIRELKGKLEALGAQGLEEERDALTGELAVVSRRADEFARNAAALSLLLNLLQEKRQALTRQLHAPLKARLMHYLSVLFGASGGAVELSVGDDLMPTHLMRQNTQAELRELSFGAREQMGLISRLAYADLLKDAGRPTLIMLDDALVHSDDTRLAHMKRILFDAATRHQILLFTCHPDKWRDVGATPRAILDLKLSRHH